MFNKYFKREEFTCKCGCGFNTVDFDLVNLLTEVRKHFKNQVIINSSCRCSSHNASVGGAATSQHLIGRAADIMVKGHTPREVYDFINGAYPDSLGLGCYNTFTHVDTRDKKARW